MRIELRLLGRFAASLDSDPPRIIQISAPRRRALLAYLAMQPSYIESRERLADLLWGNRYDKQARQSLRQALVQLRRELEPFAAEALVIERESVALNPDLVSVDAREFLALGGADEAASERALVLYRGEFLDGIEIEAEAFGDWVRGERIRIRATAVRVLETYALQQDRLGRGAEAIAAAERLAAIDPLAEAAQRLLIALEARHRGRDAALARASAFAAMLRTEVAADPEPETAALVDQIRRGELAAAPKPAALPRVAAPPRDIERSEDFASIAPEARSPADAPPPTPSVHAAASKGRRSARSWASIGAMGAVIAIAVVAGLVLMREQPRAVEWPGDRAWQSPHLRQSGVDKAALARQGVYAIIVLPFVAEGEARGPQQLLADRISDDVINDLSRAPGLRVISRATSRLYKDRPVDVAALGLELGVRYVVEGSVQVQGQAMRINVALIDAATRLQVWSERFERDRAERFAMQDEIARGIARHLQLGVLTTEDRRRPPGAGDPGVDALLAKGWAAMLRIGVQGTTSGADKYFEEVLKRDPDNVSALIGLGGYSATVVAMFVVDDVEPHLARAEANLGRAIKLNPRSSLAHYFMGVLHKTRGRPQDALASFTRTLELNPSFSPAYAQTGHVLSRIGRLDEALEHVRYAIRLSPKDQNLGLWSLFGGQIELELGRDDAALDWLRRAASHDTRNPFIPATLAAAYALRGDKPAAARHAEEARKLAPWLTTERMIERLVGLSTGGYEPKRLLQGLKIAFARPS